MMDLPILYIWTRVAMENKVDVIEDELQVFFDSLLNGQEELGEEFSKVLFDNLWDLYECL